MQQAATLFAYAAIISGPVALYFMHKIYRIKARPFWNHWQVLTAFYGNMLTMGGVLTGLVFVPAFLMMELPLINLLSVVSAMMFIGLLVEGYGHYCHANYLQREDREGAVSYYEQVTSFGKTYIARNILLSLNILVVGALYLTQSDSAMALGVWALLMVSVLVVALVSRSLFYVLVVPTTMPGAFFWKNKGFEEHARESGLAEMPQVGVIPDAH